MSKAESGGPAAPGVSPALNGGAASKQRLIASAVEERIARGLYAARVPGERELAREFGVNFKTANRAVSLLVGKGLLERRRGEGTFVVRRPRSERTVLVLALYKFGPERPDPIYAELFSAASASARELDCRVELVTPWEEKAPVGLSPEEQLEHLRARFVENVSAARPRGIVYSGNPDATVLDELERLAPVVQVSAFGREGESFVRRDPGGGIALAVRNLAEQGRRRIALARYLQTGLEQEEKLAGYRSAVKSLGLDFSREVGTRYPARRELADELLSGEGGAPDGVVCTESTIGRAVLGGLSERGLRSPRDVALWSFDDGGFGLYTIPQMSAIRVYDGDLGECAVRRLVGIIEGTVERPHRETLPAILVERESSKAHEETDQ